MLEKSLIVIIFMYSFSFSALGVQYMYADVLGTDIKNFEGVVIKSEILNYVDMPAVNTATSNIVGTNSTSVTSNPVTAAAGIAWEIIQLMSGTYIFGVLVMLGVPSIIVAGMTILYVFMLARTIIAYIRGI